MDGPWTLYQSQGEPAAAPPPDDGPWKHYQTPAAPAQAPPWEMYAKQAAPEPERLPPAKIDEGSAEPAAEPMSQAHADVNALIGPAVVGIGQAIKGAGQAYRAADVAGAREDLARQQGTKAPPVGPAGDLYATPDADAAAVDEAKIANRASPTAGTDAGNAIIAAGQQNFPVPQANQGFQTKVLGTIGGAAPAIAAGTAGALAGPVGSLAAAAAVIYPQSFSQTYDEARSKGMDHDAAASAAASNAALQTVITSLPYSRALQMIPAPMRAGFAKAAVDLAQHGIEFGTASAASTLADNYVAQNTYDPKRPLLQGVADSAETGTAAGMVLPLGGAVARHAAEVATAQPAAPALHADAAALTQMGAAHQALQPSPEAQTAKQTLVNIAAGKPADAPAEPPPQAAPQPSAWDAFPAVEPTEGAQSQIQPKTKAEPSEFAPSPPEKAPDQIQGAQPPTAPYTMVRPGDLTLDPKRFQYKQSDENGVTGALQGVTKWDSNLADPIDAYRDTDGKLYVVNGHQRTDLANRAVAAGQQDVQMPARVYDAADGHTPEQMRYLGAYRNIAQGSGTAIDAAKIMRAPVPEGMVPPELPPKSAIVQQAQGLKNLSDEAFGATINGVIPAPYAAEVGRQISDPKQQMAAIQVLHQADPPNVEQARIMVADVKNSGFLDGQQEDMFGTQAFAQSLFPERAKVLAQALQTLRGNKRVFQAAVQGEDALSAAGNRMDTAANQKGQTENEQLVDLLQRAATTRGPISDALSVSARDVAGGKQVRGAAGDFLAKARDVIRRGPQMGVEPGADLERAGPAGAGSEAGLELPPQEGPGLFSKRGTQTETPTFRNWFGDSKVVDEAGRPRVVYHGTNKSQGEDAFTAFDTYASQHGLMGQGAYFTESPDVASSYTKKGRGDRPTVYPTYLSIKHPIDMDAPADAAAWLRAFPDAADFHEGGTSNESWFRAAEDSLIDQHIPAYEGAEAMQDGIRGMGFDGITHIGGGRVNQDGVRHRVWIAFDPEQIKSATGNQGAFDPNDARLNFSARTADANAKEGAAVDHPEFQAVAEHMMRLTGLPEAVTLKLFDRLGERGPDGRGTADGAYADKLIRFALDTPPADVPAKMFHEIVHALRDKSLGLLSPQERAALDAGASRYLATGDNRAEIVKRYTTNGKPPPADVVHEEAIARLAEEALTKALARPTLGQRVAARMVNFARGLGQALRGQGFKTADDVFHAIMQGRIQGRAEGAHPIVNAPRVVGEMEARRPLITDKAGLEKEGQGALFGRSAVQAQAARDAMEGRGRGEQKPMDEGLFAPKQTEQPSLAPPHGQPMHDTAAELIKWGKEHKREALRTYDALTDQIVHQTTGEQRTVGFTREIKDALYKPSNALVIQHNHPRSTALSPDDIAQLIYPGISWAVAHGHDGSFSAAKAPDGTTPAHEAKGDADPELYRLQVAMNKRHAAANAAAIAIAHDLIRAGKFTADETRGIWSDIVNRMMAIRGHIDYMSSHVVPAVLRDELHEYAKRNGRAADNDQANRFTQSVQPSEGIARVAEDARRLAQQRAGGDGGDRPDAPVHSGPQAQPAAGRPPLVKGEQGRLFSLRDDGRDVAERERSAAQISIDLTQPRGRASLEPIRAIVRNAQEILSPTSLAGAKPTEWTVRKNAAEQARSFARTVADLSDMRDAMNRLPVEEQHAFTDRMEAGEKQATPELQAVADMLRATYDGWAKKIQSLGKGYLEDTIENYAPHIWGNYREWKAGLPTDPNADPMDRAVAGAMSKSPIRGSGAFLKQRTFATQREGMEAGLVPVSSNPVDLAMIKLREMQKMYHGTRMAEEMKQTGIAQWVPVSEEGGARGAGWVKLDDAVFKPTTTEFGGRTEFGSYWAPAEAARIFNNYTSRGISDSPIYGAIRASGNALNQLQLGLSGFHATFVTMDSAISKVAMGLRQVAGGVKRMDPALAAKGAGNVALGLPPLVPVAAAMTAYRGGQLRKAILYPEAATPEMRKIADLAMQGGARVAQQQIFRADARGSFVRNMGDFLNGHIFREIANTARNEFANHGPILGAITTPIHMASRLIETTMQPLMELYVPRAKLGVFYDMANDWAQRNPDATPEATAEAMTQAWDSVDNRMGQMVYDNLFWNKTAKDLAFIATRSVGWNLGTIRELAGAGVDTAAQAAKLAQLRAPEITHRMAYAMAMPLVTGMLGGTMTYLLTGQPPQDLLDYFYPKKSDGTRLAIPGYIKDVIDYTHAPLQTLANKTHPLLSMAQQLANNRDYYGGIIRDPQRDGVLRPYLEYLTNQVEPFALRAIQKENDQGATAMEKIAAFWGFQPAPAAIANPERGEMFQRKQDKQAYRKRMREPGRMSWPDWVP